MKLTAERVIGGITLIAGFTAMAIASYTWGEIRYYEGREEVRNEFVDTVKEAMKKYPIGSGETEED